MAALNKTKFASKTARFLAVIVVSLNVMLAPTLAHAMDADTDAVLAANSEFYRAFRESDIPAMENLWAKDAEIAVIHPGWPQLIGREDVLQSWRNILANPNSPAIRSANSTVEFKNGTALVTTDEFIEGGSIRAMNIFKLLDGKWEMTFHGAASNLSPDTKL